MSLYGFGGYGVDAFGSSSDSTDTSDGIITSGYDTLPYGEGPYGGGILRDDLLEDDALPETPYFGGGLHGQGLWAYHYEQMQAIRTAWDSGGVNLHPESDAYGLLSALSMPLGLVSDDLIEINAAHHINTAHGRELDKIGALANVQRQTGESDARYRLRIISTMRAGVTGTTHADILEFVTSLLQVPGEHINIDWAPDLPGVAIIYIQKEDLQNALITRDDLISFTTDVVPAGHRIDVRLRGTFAFGGDEYTPLPDEGFSNLPEFTGGTLTGSL